MRISDWSSDVCSSDLVSMSFGKAIAPHLPYLRRYGRAISGSQRGDVLVGCAHVGRAFHLHYGTSRVVRQLIVGVESDVRGQIGRASCRERVGQYVLISVVAVVLKKKREINIL